MCNLVRKHDDELMMPVRISSYTDADFAADNFYLKSINAVVLNVNDIVVGWSCQKQGSVAFSTAEANL